jgi:hypothetical protein
MRLRTLLGAVVLAVPLAAAGPASASNGHNRYAVHR